MLPGVCIYIFHLLVFAVSDVSPSEKNEEIRLWLSYMNFDFYSTLMNTVTFYLIIHKYNVSPIGTLWNAAECVIATKM